MLRRHAAGGAATEPDIVHGAFLLIDVVGFSRVAAELSARGALGAEELSRLVIPLFATVTDAAVGMGGDILYFAGDAVGVAFPRADGEAEHQPVLRACQAALDALAETSALVAERGEKIRVRAAIGWGECSVVEAGGYQGHWQTFVHGDGIEDLARADRSAAEGTLTLSADAFAVARQHLDATTIAGGVVRVSALRQRVVPAERRALECPPEVLETLAAVIPPSVQYRLASGVRNLIAEFRPVTAVFARIHGLDLRAADSPFQNAVAAVQRAISDAGGVVHAVIGDKGVGVLGVFGVPPLAHEDDAARAMDASIEMQSRLRRLGVSASVGVASGTVFCTEHGASERRGFDVVGATLVLAARLMQLADAGTTLCDEQTQRLADRHGHSFNPRAAAHLKGFAQPVPSFVALGRQSERPRRQSAFFGRADDLHRLDRQLVALVGGASPGVTWIEGEAGIGKSTLVQALVDLAATRSVALVMGGADAVEAQTPYYSLRGVVRSLAGAPIELAPDAAREKVVRWVRETTPEHAWLTGLLEGIVPLDLPVSDELKTMDAAARVDRLAELMAALVAGESERRPLVIVLEDLHWLGSETWNVLRAIAERAPRVWLVGTFRPLDQEPAMVTAHGERVRLTGLQREGTAALVARRLGVGTAPDELVEFVHERSEGNPLFIEEIVSSLVEADAVHVRDGAVVSDGNVSAVPLPTTITGVVTARLDRLALQVLTIAKVASVIGRSFARDLLAAILPDDELAPQLGASLDTLVAQRFIQLEPGLADVWVFRHALIQEASYALLPFAQRRPLHRAAAAHIERDHGADPAYAGRLAHHYTEADEADAASRYCAVAGRLALDAYAHTATIALLERAMTFDIRVRGELALDNRRAAWCRQIAEAHQYQLHHQEALDWYARAWTLAGWSAPRAGLRTLAELWTNLSRRWWPPRPTRDPALLARCEQVLASAADMCSILIFAGQTTNYLHAALASDNVGRLVERGRFVAETRASIGFLLVALKLPRAGMADLDTACALAESATDGHTAAPFTIRGMALVVLGRVEESLPSHRRAMEIAERFSAGLWRHRTLFMCAEATLMLGRYEETVALMSRCVPIARLAEPSSAGHATAIIALCKLRTGTAAAEVIADLDGPLGVAITAGDKALHRFSAKALLAWACWGDGKTDRALVLARESIELAAGGGMECFSYLRAIDGHLHLVLLCLDAVARASDANRAEREALLGRALGHVRKQARLHPVLAAHRDLCDGLDAARRGDTTRARTRFARSIEAARTMSLPWEEAQAALGLARLSTGAERDTLLRRAEAIATDTHDALIARDVTQATPRED